ncbi:hypothetical protein QJ48_27605 [Paenibacillus sp. A3]|uniref:hypothetical protein n=1 Tax=Paenibacillus sp. A3 TaxID=1337054 RepID=UPI0006D5A997|nr:hypothetical protein [Paenibacillus sp. A3]KPV56437.1 hypothetical protein QJ48_27605 [Paenibacillus sp. A3]
MFKIIIRGLLPLFLVFIIGCSGKSDVTLTAVSSDWNIEIFYKVVEGKYREIPSIQYIGKKPIGPEVTLDIIYKNNSATTNTLSGHNYLGMQMKVLVTRTEIGNWKDVDKIKITWSSDEGNSEETLIPKVKQSDNSEPKSIPL